MSKVLDGVDPEAGWIVRPEGIYYRTARDANGQSELRLYEFVNRTTRMIMKLGNRVGDRLSVSPDGRTILYGQSDESGSDLMLVENFR